MINRLTELVDKLLTYVGTDQEIYLYPHASIDGDALGSTLALLTVLKKAGVKARFLYDETIPDKYRFLENLHLIESYDVNEIDQYVTRQSLALCLDCSEPSRTGQRQQLLEKAPEIAVIDHHVSEGEAGYLRLIDPLSAATGELIYDVAAAMEKLTGKKLIETPEATCLMMALIADTGRFTFSNTTRRTFSIAAELMAHPVPVRDIVYQLFDLTSPSRIRISGHDYHDAAYFKQGKIVVATVSRDVMAACEADDSDLDGLPGQLRNIEGVEISFLLRELHDDSIRVNIRSSSVFDAAAFAKKMGGGGHARAAGATLKGMTLEQATQLLIEKASEVL